MASRRFLDRFLHPLRPQCGQVVVMFTLLLPVLLGISALVIDVGRLFIERRALQQAADAAALAAAQRLPGTACNAVCINAVATTAGDYKATNLGASGGHALPACGPYVPTNCYRLLGPANSPDSVEVVVAERIPTLFGGIFGVKAFEVTRRAVATRAPYTNVTPPKTTSYPGTTEAASVDTITTTTPASGPLKCALCVLSTGNPALSMNGSQAVVRVSGADVFVNGSIGISGHPDIYGDHVFIHGAHPQASSYHPAAVDGGVMTDPLAYLPVPTFNDQVVPPDAPASGTLTPGTYKDVTPNGRILQPGVYVITGTLQGPFTGNGVLLYFPSCASHPNAFPAARCTSSTPGGFWNSNAVWTLSPPMPANCSAANTCSWLGLSVFYDRGYNVIFPLQGNTGTQLSGTIYGNAIDVEFGGGPSMTTSSAVITATYHGGGNPELRIDFDSATNVQPPTITVRTETTPGYTDPGTVTTTPPVTETVSTGSNLAQ